DPVRGTAGKAMEELDRREAVILVGAGPEVLRRQEDVDRPGDVAGRAVNGHCQGDALLTGDRGVDGLAEDSDESCTQLDVAMTDRRLHALAGQISDRGVPVLVIVVIFVDRCYPEHHRGDKSQ